MSRPDITIRAENMIQAQAARLTAKQKVQVHAWADRVSDARYERGERFDTRPTQFSVPVRDSIGVLIGHIAFPT